MEALSREFRVALHWELLYTDDMVLIAETEDDLIKRLNEWKDNMENRGMRENLNKTKVMISGKHQKVTQKAVIQPCGVCGRGVGNNPIQCTSCKKWVHRKCSGINGSMYKVTKTFVCRGSMYPLTDTERNIVCFCVKFQRLMLSTASCPKPSSLCNYVRNKVRIQQN